MTKIYQIKQGYHTIANFEDINKATEFFGLLIRNSGKRLMSISGKGDEPKKAYFWGSENDYSISIMEVEMYATKKDAEFAVFENGKSDDAKEE